MIRISRHHPRASPWFSLGHNRVHSGTPGKEQVGVRQGAVGQVSGRKHTVAGRQDVDRELCGKLGLEGSCPGSLFFPLSGAAELPAEVY